MRQTDSAVLSLPNALLANERAWLVRFCARLTNNPDAAEDLAQETLLEAWRNLQKFRDAGTPQEAESRQKWLSAIARNVCKRWLHHRSRDPLSFRLYEHETEQSIEEMLTEPHDIELELEQAELAQLLEQALKLLPASTRTILIARYIHELPHTEIAARMGLSEDATLQRLYRSKQALRQAITRHLPEAAAAYGLVIPEDERLHQDTRIWCPMCNKARLRKYVVPNPDRTGFYCPQCCHIASHNTSLEGLSSPKSMLARQITALGEYYWHIIDMQHTTFPCTYCSTSASISLLNPENILDSQDVPDEYRLHAIQIYCSTCGCINGASHAHLILDVPELRNFWRKHPRIRWIGGAEIEYQGQRAITGSYQSADGHHMFTVINHYKTLKILGIHESTR